MALLRAEGGAPLPGQLPPGPARPAGPGGEQRSKEQGASALPLRTHPRTRLPERPRPAPMRAAGNGGIGCLAIDFETDVLYAGAGDGRIRVWNLKTRALLRVLDHHSDRVRRR